MDTEDWLILLLLTMQFWILTNHKGANAIEKHENKDSSEDNSENDDLDTAISEAEKEERSRLKRLKKRRAKMNTKLREKLSLQVGILFWHSVYSTYFLI